MSDHDEPVYVCDIEARVKRGREQYRYVVHRRLSSSGTEVMPTGRWTRSREKAETKGRHVRAVMERRLLENPVVVGRVE